MKQEFVITASSQPIYCYIWVPDHDPRGVIQIVHGIKEYAERYDELATYFAEQGFIVTAADHPGHGKHALQTGKLGYLDGGWKRAVRNIHSLHKHMLAMYPNLPYIILGHSMGSFMLTTYLSVAAERVDAAIISGTGWLPELLLNAGMAMCKIEDKRIGETERSPLLEKLMFGSYNRRIRNPETASDWICSSKPVVYAYSQDPLCTWVPTVQICTEMLHAMKRNQNSENLRRIPSNLPIFFIAGQEDPVGDYGNGVLKAVSKFKVAGCEDITVELYPHMRHECHNEQEKDQVYTDLLHWINTKINVESTNGCNL